MKIKLVLFILLFSILAACGAEESVNEETENDSVEEQLTSVSFRNLDMQIEKTSFVLKGEVKAENNIFYYQIDQGEEELLSEHSIELDLDENGWGNFEIEETISEAALDGEDSPIITMYGKQDGEIVNPNYIPIDIGVK